MYAYFVRKDRVETNYFAIIVQREYQLFSGYCRGRVEQKQIQVYRALTESNALTAMLQCSAPYVLRLHTEQTKHIVSHQKRGQNEFLAVATCCRVECMPGYPPNIHMYIHPPYIQQVLLDYLPVGLPSDPPGMCLDHHL